MGLTLYEKIWHAHKVLDGDDGQSLLHVARHLVHDGSVHAFQFLKEKGLSVRRPDQVVAARWISAKADEITAAMKAAWGA